MKRALALCLAVLLATASVAPAASQSTDIRTLDGQTILSSDRGVDQFQSEGQVTTDVEEMQLSVTVADNAADVNASGWHIDETTTFLRVDYDEGINRRVRIHIDREIVLPRPKQGKQPIGDSNVTADFETADGGEVQSVTLHLTGQTDAVFALSDVRGQIYQFNRGVHDAVSQFSENVTGVPLPTLGSGQWQRIDSAELSGSNVTHPVPDSSDANGLTVQYRAGNNSWYNVPECQADAPVCTLERNNQTLIFSQSADAPAVRYKHGNDLLADVNSALDDVGDIPDRMLDSVSDLGGDR